jgi:predicted DNA-binding protein (MmcQ/YjbR family)
MEFRYFFTVNEEEEPDIVIFEYVNGIRFLYTKHSKEILLRFNKKKKMGKYKGEPTFPFVHSSNCLYFFWVISSPVPNGYDFDYFLIKTNPELFIFCNCVLKRIFQQDVAFYILKQYWNSWVVAGTIKTTQVKDQPSSYFDIYKHYLSKKHRKNYFKELLF